MPEQEESDLSYVILTSTENMPYADWLEYRKKGIGGSDASTKFLTERFPNSVPKSQITLPPSANELLSQYDEACERLENAGEQKQKAENLLKQMLGESEVGTTGDRIVTWKSITQERLDSRTLKAEYPTLYKKYANKTIYRRFTVKAMQELAAPEDGPYANQTNA